MIRKLCWFVVLAIIIGCGGGGAGTNPTAVLVGRVLQVSTGGAPNPQASVQVGSASVLTDVTDGSFTLTVTPGATSITVDSRGSSGVWTFTIPAASGTQDVGDLWIGPDRVALKGKVVRSTDGSPISGAIVEFGGKTGTTNAGGLFTLPEVAYSAANQTAFWGIVGSVRAANFFRNDFTASPNVAVSGVVTVNDIPLTPSNDTDPPPPAYNIWGHVLPSSDAPGTVVTLKQAGTPVRVVNVGSTGVFTFWITPGTYTIEALKGSRTGTATVTLTAPNQVVQKDVTLP